MLAALFAVLWRRPSLFVVVAVADAVAQLLAYVLKAIVGEERPAFRYAEPKPLVHVPHDGSFPSGHAASSFACATVLLVAAPRLAPLFVLLAAAIAFSRVYVGVHYPFDVIAGAALGIAVAAVLLALVRRVRGGATGLPLRGRGRLRSRRAPKGG